MKLSKKINLILLPVMMVVFSIAGLYSYNSQKQQVDSFISDMFSQEVGHISDELGDTVNELIYFSQLLLTSNRVRDFLNNTHDNKYYLEKQLVDYIKQINIRRGNLVSIGLLDKNQKELFYINFLDPFSRLEYNKNILDHLDYIDKKTKNPGIVNLLPMTYDFRQINSGGEEVILVRTFSPDQPISSTSFSHNLEIYTAIITMKMNAFERHLSSLKELFGDNVKLEIFAHGKLHDVIKERSEIVKLTKSELIYGLTLTNNLWHIALTASRTELRKLYKPYQKLYVGVVVFITILMFFILKWLITKQIISPIVKLTTQVEKIDADKKINLHRTEGNDEVSLLTNKYLDLIVELDDLAKRDHLTGLPNRNQFNTDLERFITQSEKYKQKCAVIYFDLDNFKSVNDVFGHHVGDEILKEFSKRLVESYVDLDWDNIEVSEFEFARLSGDEFTIILSEIKDLDILALFSQKILSLFDGGFRFNNVSFDLGASIGIAVYPNDAQDANTLVKCADMAMYAAKNEQKNGYKFYSDELDSEIKRNEKIAVSLRNALAKNEFKLVYMPVFDSQSGKVQGAEALLRATSEELLSFGPAEFIPIAETSGIIKDIDCWVIEAAIKQLSGWIEEYNFDGVLAINFSSWQLKNPEFVQMVASLLKQYDVPPECVELEITETCFVPGESRNLEVLTELHQLGVKLSLDDFGTGFTAFSQLIEYPMDTLKVDRMFVNAIDGNSDDNKALIDMIVEIAKLYKLNVIAEGVETIAQLEHIRQIRCQQVQGFLLSKPISEDQFIQLWQSQLVPTNLESLFGDG